MPVTLVPYFSASSKVWEPGEWVYGIEEAGYRGWEVVADGRYSFDQPGSLAKVKELLSTTGLSATVHAPYSDLNLASMNHPIWRESIRQVCVCIEGAAGFTNRVTIHPGYVSPVGKLVPEKVWQQQKDALREIGSFARDRGVTACLENMGGIREFLCRDPGELLGMIDGIEGIGFTCDLGHAHTVGKVQEFLAHLSRASHLHLHDNHGSHDEHLALGDGTIDWAEAGPVVARNYSGIAVVEGRNLEEATRSLSMIAGWFP
jgi:sugar phosphate isomerase/epimerase